MTFHHLLNRVRSVWQWSALVAIGFFVVPLFAPFVLFRFAHQGMMPLDRRYFDLSDAFNWCVWLLHVGAICCLASAVIALAAYATYIIGRKLPDYTDIVSPS